MYEIVKIINSTLRDQAFSNPFEYMMDNQLATFGATLGKVAFTMCGIFYKSRSNKTLGSIGYMFFYFINVQVLIKLCQWFQNINLVISIFIVLYKIKNGIRQIIMAIFYFVWVSSHIVNEENL